MGARFVGGLFNAVQAVTRNLYQTKFPTLEYRDGLGKSYNEQIRSLSWPVPDDVPAHAQPSATAAVMKGAYSSLQPAPFLRPGSELNFMQTHGSRPGSAADSFSPVHTRLYVPSKTMSRPPSRTAAGSRPELDGDAAFAKGMLSVAISKYTLALAQARAPSARDRGPRHGPRVASP